MKSSHGRLTGVADPQYQIEKERHDKWLDGCKIVDCVIYTHETRAGVGYFVKWKRKFHSEANVMCDRNLWLKSNGKSMPPVQIIFHV